MHARHWFDGRVASVPAARHWVIDQLADGGRDRWAEDAAMCVSELAANAVDHTGHGFEVAVSDGDGHIRVAVTDSEEHGPEMRPLNPRADRGRGMLILDAVAARWGVDPLRGRGKTVWFELE